MLFDWRQAVPGREVMLVAGGAGVATDTVITNAATMRTMAQALAGPVTLPVSPFPVRASDTCGPFALEHRLRRGGLATGATALLASLHMREEQGVTIHRLQAVAAARVLPATWQPTPLPDGAAADEVLWPPSVSLTLLLPPLPAAAPPPRAASPPAQRASLARPRRQSPPRAQPAAAADAAPFWDWLLRHAPVTSPYYHQLLLLPTTAQRCEGMAPLLQAEVDTPRVHDWLRSLCTWAGEGHVVRMRAPSVRFQPLMHVAGCERAADRRGGARNERGAVPRGC